MNLPLPVIMLLLQKLEASRKPMVPRRCFAKWVRTKGLMQWVAENVHWFFLCNWKWKLGRLGKLATWCWILSDYQRNLAFVNLWDLNLRLKFRFFLPLPFSDLRECFCFWTQSIKIAQIISLSLGWVRADNTFLPMPSKFIPQTWSDCLKVKFPCPTPTA